MNFVRHREGKIEEYNIHTSIPKSLTSDTTLSSLFGEVVNQTISASSSLISYIPALFGTKEAVRPKFLRGPEHPGGEEEPNVQGYDYKGVDLDIPVSPRVLIRSFLSTRTQNIGRNSLSPKQEEVWIQCK